MENRMKQHPLTPEQMDALLETAKVGHLATQNSDGYPYVVPVHFVHNQNGIYIHGLIRGQKIQNIQANDKVGFEVARMDHLIMNEKSYDVNTKYHSVILLGSAQLIEDTDEKIEALNQIVEKYTPTLAGQTFPEEMLNMTSIIKITIKEITGKFYE